MLSGSARRCGVLGDPIAHSLSPALHRAGYAAVGLDWRYDAHRVRSGELATFLAGLNPQWRGLSLTMPLKREALPLVDRLSPVARVAGAVNTLVLDGGRVSGDNTDVPGAVAALRERYDGPVRSATVLGGGATAASVLLGVAELGCRDVVVAVRSPDRAGETVAAAERYGRGLRVRLAPLPGSAARDRADGAGADAVAGPGIEGETRPGAAGGVGPMGAEVTGGPLPDHVGGGVVAGEVVVSTVPVAAQTPALVAACRDVPVVFDVVYDPWPTPLAAAATASGRTLVTGLDLLVHQAALQFLAFTGVPAPLPAMRAAGEAALAHPS